MYRVCGLRLGPNIGVAKKKFYLWLTPDEMHVFAVFTEKNLRSYGCSGTNFTTAVNCTNPNTEIQSEIIETEIIEAKM